MADPSSKNAECRTAHQTQSGVQFGIRHSAFGIQFSTAALSSCAALIDSALEPPDALAIVGHPISPPDRPRPRDEEVLAAMTCPTLVVQGSADELGPIAVLERIAGQNPRIDLVVMDGAGHDLGALEREAVEHVARWLDAALR